MKDLKKTITKFVKTIPALTLVLCSLQPAAQSVVYGGSEYVLAPPIACEENDYAVAANDDLEKAFEYETDAEPEITAEPDVSATPETSAEPGASATPETTAKPSASAIPGTTAEPDASTEPDATATPITTTGPNATTEPDSTPEPDATAVPTETPSPGGLRTHSKEDIIQKYNSIISNDARNVFEEQPSLTAPYKSGKVNQTILREGLEYYNFMRYLAYLPPVEITDEKNDFAQHGATLMAATDQMSHTPPQPSDMDDEFYQTAYAATSSSNIAYYSGGQRDLRISIDMWMDDGDSSNIDVVGHRRWILNPDQKYIGFGLVPPYSSVAVFDESRSEKVEYDYISWPAEGYFPKNVFSVDTPWSVSLNPEKFARVNMDDTSVSITREIDNETCVLDKSDYSSKPDEHDAYFNINREGYGTPNCIIFRPPYNFLSKDFNGKYIVEISGIRDKSGNETSLSYPVEFFGTDLTIDSRSGSGGSISPSGKVTVEYGSDITFKITPSSGYRISDVIVDGFSVGSVSTYTFENIKNDSSIEAIFEKTYNSNTGGGTGGGGGSFSGGGGGGFSNGGGYIGGTTVATPSYTETPSNTTPESNTVSQNSSGSLPFVDVNYSDWYYDGVEYAYANGLMNGTSATLFEPEATMTRGMLVTVLGRAEGVSGGSGSAFSDVDPNEYYAPYIAWASNCGIVNGVGGGMFEPDDTVTREQIAKIFKGYYEYLGDAANSSSAVDYADAYLISDWAVPGVAFCKEKGLMQGKDGNMFDPQGGATRAEAATILMRAGIGK